MLNWVIFEVGEKYESGYSNIAESVTYLSQASK